MSLISKFLFCLFIASVSSMATTYVAVVETIASEGVLSRDEKNFITDRLRERANAVLPEYMGYAIMTRENIEAMLPPGKSIEECEGNCLVETGRNINANYIAQARVGKFGESLTLTVELYETQGNKLVDSFTASEPRVEGFLADIDSKAELLFKHVLRLSPAIKVAPKKEVDVRPANHFNQPDFNQPKVGDARKEATKRHKLRATPGNYPSVKIGQQVWMKRNLDFATPDSRCYEDKPENCEKFGRLYTWEDAKDICPEGWHLPSNGEWKQLFDAVGGVSNAGKKLKSAKGWYNGGNGIDSFGFTVLPASGSVVENGSHAPGTFAYFWSSTTLGGNVAYWYFSYNSTAASFSSYGNGRAFSVRCVK